MGMDSSIHPRLSRDEHITSGSHNHAKQPSTSTHAQLYHSQPHGQHNRQHPLIDQHQPHMLQQPAQPNQPLNGQHSQQPFLSPIGATTVGHDHATVSPVEDRPSSSAGASDGCDGDADREDSTGPDSTGHEDNDHATPKPGTSGAQAGNKKPRACDNCRKAKVGCHFNPAKPGTRCKRCERMNKPCHVSPPTRKRAKRNDPNHPRILELEQKIEALTRKLATTGQQSNDSNNGTTSMGGAEGPSGVSLGTKQKQKQEHDRGSGWVVIAPPPSQPAQALSPQSSNVSNSPISPPAMATTPGRKRKFVATRDNLHDDIRETIEATSAPLPVDAHEYHDMIHKGIITQEQADRLFRRYTDRMAPHLPGVVFPAATKYGQVRKDKPILFLSIMAASSSDMPEVQQVLVKELMQVIAHKVVIVGEKSVELIQALHVAVIWYWLAPHFAELKFYTFVQIALATAQDIGLGKKQTIAAGGLTTLIPRPMPRKARLPDPTTIESRRTWLTCYLLSTSTSMALHRPHSTRWDSFLEECVDVLQTSPDAAPTDAYLCRLVWTHRLAEEIGTRFEMHNSEAAIDIAAMNTQYALNDFEGRLSGYVEALPKEERDKPALEMAFHVLNLYMHESVITMVNVDDGKMTVKTEDDQAKPTARRSGTDSRWRWQHTDSLSNCVEGCLGVINTFTRLPVEAVRCLPVLNFARVAYAVVVLLRIHRAAAVLNSDLKNIVGDLRTEQHLDKLIDLFQAAAAEDKCRPAMKFLAVIQAFRTILKDGSLTSGSGPQNDNPNHRGKAIEDTGTAHPHPSNPAQQQQQQALETEYSAMANTPLQVLSEIASNANDIASSSTAGHAPQQQPRDGNGIYGWANSGPQPGPSSEQYYNNHNPNSNPLLAPNVAANMPQLGENMMWPNAEPDPWIYSLNIGTMGTFGDGFAQAMELTGLADTGMGLGTMDPGYGMPYVPQQQGHPQAQQPSPMPPPNFHLGMGGINEPGVRGNAY